MRVQEVCFEKSGYQSGSYHTPDQFIIEPFNELKRGKRIFLHTKKVW